MRKSSSVPMLIFVLFVGVCLSITAHAQEAETPIIEWSLYIGGSQLDEPNSIVISPEGHIYVSGMTGSEDLSGHINKRQFTSSGYLTKISEDGDILWALFTGGEFQDQNCMAALGREGNIYLAGLNISLEWEKYIAWVDPLGPYLNAYIQNVTPDGEILWTKFLGGDGGDSISHIDVCPEGNIYAVGITNTVNLDNRLNEYSGGVSDAFLARLGPDGSLKWIKYIGGQEGDTVSKLAIMADGDILILGNSGSADLPAKTNDFRGERDAYLTRISPDGEIRWTTYVGSFGHDTGMDMALDSTGSIFMVGRTYGVRIEKLIPTGDEDGYFLKEWEYDPKDDLPGALNSRIWSPDAFVAKLTPDGEIIWTKYLGGSYDDIATSIAVDAFDNIYIAGTTESRDFMKSINDDIRDRRNAFLVRIDSSGELGWSFVISGDGFESSAQIAERDGIIYMAASTESRNLPNKLNEIHYNHEEQRLRPDVFVMRIRLPIDAEGVEDF